MAKPSERRPTDENRRLVMRLAAVAAGYIAYRVIESSSLAGAILVGLGVWLLGVSRVERQMNSAPTERQRTLQAVGPRVAIGMIVLGSFLAVI